MLEKIKYLTAGESHGLGLLGIVEGIPSHLILDEDISKFSFKEGRKDMDEAIE